LFLTIKTTSYALHFARALGNPDFVRRIPVVNPKAAQAFS